MVTTTDTGWGVRLTTLALWALAAASVAYWGLRLSAPLGGGVPAVTATPPSAPDTAAISRLLGGGAVSAAVPQTPQTPAPTTGRLALVGVLAGHSSGSGAALIAVDGQSAKPFRVGVQVADGLVLQALEPRQARLGATATGPTTLTLDMPLRR
ncbi:MULTISPECIES: type II secretion system protein N [Giesbergeria]|uniref:Type II secretion system protein N n=1 Tax=Giesbergeria sinuosa TaxID=80883 RepID=A0ABV9Q9N3_9BURK